MVTPEEPQRKPRIGWKEAVNGSVIVSFWLGGLLAAVELISRAAGLL